MAKDFIGKIENLFSDGFTVSRFRVNNEQVLTPFTCLDVEYNFTSEMLLKFSLNSKQFWLPFGAY